MRGEGRFVAPRTVEGGGVRVSAPLVVINTGATPAVPAIEGLSDTPFLTSHSVFDLTTRPARLAVLGGGYIGLELGQGLARLGSKTHIVHRGARLLDREEADVGKTLAEALARDGIDVKLGAATTRVAYQDGVFTLTLGDASSLTVDALLVATGRQPNTAGLDAAAGGIELTREGFVRIDDQFRTTSEGVYAIGDVAGQPAFTHVAWEDYRRLTAILRGEPRTRADRVHGYTAFTDPQVGRVGLDLVGAKAAGHNARAVTLPLAHVARGIELGQTEGFFRLVVDVDSEAILGATCVSPEGGELVHVMLALMEAGAGWRTLERSVHIHPTWSEGLPSLARLLVEG